MPSNTVYGPFVTIPCVDGVTAINQTWGNNSESQSSVAVNSLNGDLALGSFVLSGITCARNGVTLNQLDVATGIAYRSGVAAVPVAMALALVVLAGVPALARRPRSAA